MKLYGNKFYLRWDKHLPIEFKPKISPNTVIFNIKTIYSSYIKLWNVCIK